MAVSVDPLVGRTLGDFVLRERFAAGGGGDVYLADQVTLGRQVVVKVVHQLGDAPQRFLREARLASRLDHPFVAHVYGFGAEEDGTLWMAMELVRGTPLDVLIKQQGAIPLPRFVPLFERLCEVLHAAHEQGIVHRDIKPHNIMVLNRAGRLLPKLLDLGISRRIGKDVEIAAPLVPPRPLAPADDDGWERTVTLPRGGDATVAPVVAPPATSAPSPTSRTARRLAESETFELTQAGQVMGTPHYIAPEQWRGSAQADPRADLYSLAIVAYEALTGRLPYAEVRTIDELIEAQQKRPLPPLPDGLPLLLHEVLARGAARDPNERYPTALALGAAVREACGLGVEADELPGLPHDLLDNFTREAPQPIAEAIAHIEAARTERQQHEAITLASRVIVRWLALVALACHARVAPTSESESTERLIRKLAESELDDAEWAALAAALVAPYRERAATFPLPELVAACSLPVAQEHSLPSFAAWLRQLLFVLDYPLVIDGERWMGTRRADRLTQLTVDPVAPDELRLVDAVGCTVVVLSPLLQRFAPSGGMAQEVFFFEGRGRHGARLVAHPASFELQSEAPFEWLVAQRFAIDASKSAVEREATPYKGLETFGPADADNYFGREREAESFANRLRQASFLAVVGPSGTGKSSFVLAGVLPLLPRDTEVIVMRPGATPRLPVLASDKRPRLLVVDQFEELITLCPDPAMREAFAAELCAIATGDTRVVITLRDDFLLKVQQLAAMRERLSRSLQLLGTPARDDLLRVLTEPARRVGYGFDDPELPAQMVDTVLDRPGALALLSFAASQLWELRDRAMRHMRAKTYEAIGGVGGALGQHAETTLAAMNDGERKLVREAFRHLVTAERTRAVLTRAELTELLGADASTVIERLVSARILVTSADAHDRVEIIHEALIESWPRLSDWMREDAENARLRDSLRASARQWQERGRPKGLLWRAETLTEYKVWRARYPGRLTQSEEAFAAASLRDELRGKRIRQGLAATAFAGLSVALVLIFGAYREAKQRFLALRQEQARLALIDVQPLKALAYLEDAVKNGADNRSLRRMAGFIDYQLAGSRGIVARHANAVWKTAMSHDGTRWASITDDVNTTLSDGRVIATKVVCNEGIFTARDRRLVMGCLDGTALPIDPVTGALDPPIALGEQPVWDVTARRDDELVLISQPRVGVRQVNVRTGAITDVWRDPEAPPVRTDVDRDDRHVAIFSGSGTIDVKSQKGLLLLPDEVRLFPEVVVHDAEFSRDGSRLVMGTADGQVGVYDVATKTMLWKKALRPDKIISHAEFSPDGSMVLANDAETTLYDAATGAVRWSVPPGGGSLCWAPDSQRIFTGGGSGVLEARDVGTGDIVWRHHGHGNVLTHCRVTPDGNTVITSSESGTVRLWDAWQRIDRLVPASTIGKMRNLPASSAANTSAVITQKGLFAIDADRKPRALVEEPVADNAVVTVDTADNGSIAFSIERRLRIHDGKQIVSELTLPGPIIFMAYNQGGSRVASFLLSAGATLITSREGAMLQKLIADDHVDVSSLLFVDDHTLAVCNLNGDLRLWDVDAGKQVAKVKAHGGQCSLERDLDGGAQTFRTLAEDRGVAWWRWTEGKLVERDRQILARAPRAFALGADPVALTATGHLALFDERGLLLGELRTRAGELPAATTRGDHFHYWDRAGNFAEMTPPGIVSPAILQTLDRCRGLWDLKADHLTERASEPSCSSGSPASPTSR